MHFVHKTGYYLNSHRTQSNRRTKTFSNFFGLIVAKVVEGCIIATASEDRRKENAEKYPDLHSWFSFLIWFVAFLSCQWRFVLISPRRKGRCCSRSFLLPRYIVVNNEATEQKKKIQKIFENMLTRNILNCNI